MDTIAMNSNMSKEMMVTLMKSSNGMMLMMEKMKEGNKDMKKMGRMHNMKGMDKKAKK